MRFCEILIFPTPEHTRIKFDSQNPHRSILMELQIDNDLVSIRAKVRRLRAALVSRCVQRNQHSSGRPGLPILPEQRLVSAWSTDPVPFIHLAISHQPESAMHICILYRIQKALHPSYILVSYMMRIRPLLLRLSHPTVSHIIP